jgi:HlyD family secretion protein
VSRYRFLFLLLILLTIAGSYYLLTTDNSTDLVLMGTVDANQVIVSSKVAGRIEKLLVDEGTEVKEGQHIATIDRAEFVAQKQQAEATLNALRSQVKGSSYTEQTTKGETSSQVTNARARVQAARAELAAADAEFERQRGDTERLVALAQQGIASKQDRERAEAALRAAQARVNSAREQVSAAEADLNTAVARTGQASTATSAVQTLRGQMAAAEAELAQANTRLGYTEILSPVSGTVSVRAARRGEVVNPGTPIVTIVDLNDTWVRAPIPETEADSIGIGDVLKVRLPSGRTLDGKVITKSVESDFATQRDVSRRKRDIKTFALRLSVDNKEKALAPGMTAEVLVPKSKLRKK